MSIYLDKAISFDTSELTEASDVITITGMEHTVKSESSTADTLTTINLDATLLTSLGGRGMLLLLTAKAGHTITITHTSAATAYTVKTTDGLNFILTENKCALLRYNPVSTQWNMIGGFTTSNQALATYGSGAISVFYGVALLTNAGATTYTLADPTAGSDDGKILRIMSTTAQAHKVDNSAGSGFNVGGAGADTLTFGANIGDCAELLAYNGDWYVLNLRNVTITAS